MGLLADKREIDDILTRLDQRRLVRLDQHLIHVDTIGRHGTVDDASVKRVDPYRRGVGIMQSSLMQYLVDKAASDSGIQIVAWRKADTVVNWIGTLRLQWRR